MLHLEKACIHFNGQPCLRDIDLSINAEGITVIVGPNGSGKTVLLRLLAGLLAPSSGRRHCSNTFLSMTYPHISWVPQTPVLLDRTVLANLLLPLQANHIDNAHERAHAALAWANITSLSALPAVTLSTGQQQLLALARAWSLTPHVLLLDEPCANLDPHRQQHVEQLIQQLSNEGCKIVMSSHHLSQAQRLADDVVFVSSGHIVAHTSSHRFFAGTHLSQETPTHTGGHTSDNTLHPSHSSTLSSHLSDEACTAIRDFIRYA